MLYAQRKKPVTDRKWAEKFCIRTIRCCGFPCRTGIIRSEPGGFRSRYVLIPHSRAFSSPNAAASTGRILFSPFPAPAYVPRREHDDGRGDKAQIRYASHNKTRGKTMPGQGNSRLPDPGPASPAVGLGILYPRRIQKQNSREGCRQKAGGKEKGVPFPACRRRCQEDVKRASRPARIFPGGSFSNARSGGGAGGESGMVGNLSGRLQYKRGKLPCQEQAPCCMREDASKCQSSGGQDGKGVRKPDRIK